MVRLGDIAEVRFGIKTGANEFFYLDQRKINEWGIEDEYLKPVIKSPRECKSILINPKDLKFKILMCHEDKSELRGTNVLEYIKWGEKKGFHERPSCRGRARWYDLGKWNYPTLFWSDAYNIRYLVAMNTGNIFGDKRFFFIDFDESSILATSYLNSILTPFFIELQGIVNLGQGVIYTNVYWLKEYQVLANEKVSDTIDKNHLIKAFDRLSKRPIRSIFDELGLVEIDDYSNINPDYVSLDKVLPDRRELDRIVCEALGLDENDQLEIYKAVVSLVKNRLSKAGSV